jgi:hemerythrin
MSDISDFNIALTAETDREHQIQLGLIGDLCRAAKENQDAGLVQVIIEQLIGYSEAHFMSEELLMRMKSYDDYEDHVDDHNHMLEMLQEIVAGHAAANWALVAGKAESILDFITRHIATRDRRFADFVRNGL